MKFYVHGACCLYVWVDGSVLRSAKETSVWLFPAYVISCVKEEAKVRGGLAKCCYLFEKFRLTIPKRGLLWFVLKSFLRQSYERTGKVAM
jgi:hypothetical protein